MFGSDIDADTDLLPPDWVTEGVEDARNKTIGDEQRIELHAAFDAQFFGIRLGGRHIVALHGWAKISFDYSVVESSGADAVHVVMREWEGHRFVYQSQKLLSLTRNKTHVELYFSIREPGMSVEPVLLFERNAHTSHASVLFTLENVKFTST